eukprot:TRINITY_DN3009_c0_g1_i2.p1 TRINITY_DN3009_c0_g1~~TRINITY_DN3009_c0_g1_i2.p1  ORF type:complete len:521 (-),score=141.74 TRINITY_DN3009_c0_g1_i2:59-1621(-)
MHVIALDGDSLTPDELFLLSEGGHRIKLTDDAWDRVGASRALVDQILRSGEVAYGINTGFGNFANVTIPPDQLQILQENLIRSHSAGVGAPLPLHRVRMLLVLRINVLAKGHSGIRPSTLKSLLNAFNADCLSYIPEQGTVGASGDLAPLAHLALGLMGEGKMWDHERGEWSDAKSVLEKHNLQPIELAAKEGLALINGTQFMTALGVEALVRAERIAKQADVVAALTLEVLKGSVRAFNTQIHRSRPHRGQMLVAARLRALMHEEEQEHDSHSEISDSHKVHGIAHDTLGFVRQILTTEINSATDNPMVFPSTGRILSGGNFHGEYPAKALDFLAIGIHEISSISERRVERLVNPQLSELPAFLVKQGGLNSGFMIAHCTAAALVSENKVLCHPASVDSISTSAAKEDHVSMGGFSARKALQVVTNVERVVAIELLCACQGLEFLRPLHTTKALEAVHALVRTRVKSWDQDRFMSPDIEAATVMLQKGEVWNAVNEIIAEFMDREQKREDAKRPHTARL